MDWWSDKRPNDPYGLREPFPMGSGNSESTPIHSPVGLLVVGIVMVVVTVVFGALGAFMYLTGRATDDTPLWQFFALWLVMLAPGVYITRVGAVRVAWQRRYRRLSGTDPEIDRG
ncbi:hypothetical protein [Brooklawnia cerclae]